MRDAVYLYAHIQQMSFLYINACAACVRGFMNKKYIIHIIQIIYIYLF